MSFVPPPLPPLSCSPARCHFRYEFSQDVQGIFQASCFFLVLYWCLLFVLAWIKNHAKGKGLQYVVVKYVFVSMLVQWVGLLFNLAHYAKYAHDGVGVPELESSYFCSSHAHARARAHLFFWMWSEEFVRSSRSLPFVCPSSSFSLSVFEFTSNLILLFAVLSICKGWAISTNHIADRRLLLVLVGVLFALYIALFIWVREIMDPASVLYMYDRVVETGSL